MVCDVRRALILIVAAAIQSVHQAKDALIGADPGSLEIKSEELSTALEGESNALNALDDHRRKHGC